MQVNMIRGLSKSEYFQLRELCFFSNCLYNVALYNVRQHFFENKTYLRYENNYNLCKDNENFKLLQSNMAQQTLRAADFAFKSFFGSCDKVKIARPPRYREKGGYLILPASKTYTSTLNTRRIRIKIPERLIRATQFESWQRFGN